MRAVLAGDVNGVRGLLAAHPGMLRERGGWEPLIVAARKGLCETAALLLDHGAAPNAAAARRAPAPATRPPPPREIELAIRRKTKFEANPDAHTYQEEDGDGQESDR